MKKALKISCKVSSCEKKMHKTKTQHKEIRNLENTRGAGERNCVNRKNKIKEEE